MKNKFKRSLIALALQMSVIVAATIYDRHDTLSSFFESIGVSHDTAVNDACRIEHVISDETMNKIKEHMKK